jgi:hypothetical protein
MEWEIVIHLVEDTALVIQGPEQYRAELCRFAKLQDIYHFHLFEEVLFGASIAHKLNY